MIKLSVTNCGERVVHRFGFTFLPGETNEVEVTHQRQVLALQAVRTLEVVVHEEKEEKAEQNSEKPKQKPKPQQKSEK